MAQNFTSMSKFLLFSALGTYNNMQNQLGYCKMTGFNTISRSTSSGPPLFTSGRVKFGVGLSKHNFGSDTISSISNKVQGQLACGMCLNITYIDNLPQLNFELTDHNKTFTKHAIAMVFDQCNDPICTENFLDIDVYDNNIFHQGNTQNIFWTAIECPMLKNEKPEYLICTDITCKQQDTKYLQVNQFKQLFNPYYFTITIRNYIRPITNLFIRFYDEFIELPYIASIGYVFNGYSFKTSFNEDTLYIKFIDANNNYYYDNFNMTKLLNTKTTTDYHGGIVITNN